MNKKYVIAIAAIVILVAGGIFYSKNKSMPGSNPDNNGNKSVVQNDKNVVTYTDSGFSPQSLTVKLGETVKFQNQSSRGMWVASAPHPVHTDYPGFDAKKAYNAGEAYSFTFDKAGTWKFHNHMNPTDFGSVTVE